MAELDQRVFTSAVAVGDAATELPADPIADRQGYLIQNLGPDTVYLGGEGVTVETGVQLVVNGTFSDSAFGARVSLYGICDTGGSADVRVMELA